MVIKLDPRQCAVNQYTPAVMVRNWPLLSNKSAIAFKRHTGIKVIEGQLHRLGNHIFEVGEADLARCVYNHSRQF